MGDAEPLQSLKRVGEDRVEEPGHTAAVSSRVFIGAVVDHAIVSHFSSAVVDY